ncbi:MAG TPA: nucleotidyltransferase family protein [Methanoregulaceae archaeon]|nr:nucleotidyltransferase family protein [Methanoregulaceae archaeon]
MPTAIDLVTLLQRQIDVISREYGIRRIGLFGSVARGDDGAESDIDVLVEFADPVVTLDRYMDLKFCLEDLFGRRVGLVIRGTLKPRIRRSVEEETVYVEVPAPVL